jgi:pyruvate formate lyase activating enzyme
MAEVLRDQAFYRSSGGGITLSGGEPLLQPAFARALLAACQAAGLHTAVETTLHTRWPQLAALLPLVDLFMVDIKHLDPERHRAATGVDNRLILSNLKRLAATGKPITVRIPVVPTVNATPEEVGAIARFVRQLREARHDGGAGLALELLPFHRLASDKYTSLGLEYRAAGLAAPSKADMAALGAVAAEAGVTVRIR